MKKLACLAVLFTKLFTASSQNVGIGIINPTRAKLEVHGAAGNGATSAIFGGESTSVSLQRNWPGIGFNQYYDGGSKHIANGFAAVQYLDPNYGGIFFDLFQNGVANAFCSPPKRVLSIFQSGTIGFHGSSYTSSFNSGANEDTYIRSGKDNGRVIINDVPGGRTTIRGRVGINTSFPEESLRVQGEFTLTNDYDVNSWSFYVNNNFENAALELSYEFFLRGIFNKNSGSYSSLSDSRLKRNINKLPSLLGKVMQLQPVEYEMIFDNPEQSKTIGFIAQDVKKLFPELVNVIPNDSKNNKGITDLHTLNYSGIGILAIKAIQEQQQLIQDQQQKIDLLDKEVQQLKKLVNDLLNLKK